MTLNVIVTTVWLVLGALFLLQYKRLREDPSKGDGSPPQRWRVLGVIFLALAAIRLIGIAADV